MAEAGRKMPVRMVKLERTPSGWKARKSLPADVRGTYQRLYGQSREIKVTWHGIAESKVKQQFAKWLDQVEGRIANIRAAQKLRPSETSDKFLRAIAGREYHEAVNSTVVHPGDRAGLEAAAHEREPWNPDDRLQVDQEIVTMVLAKYGVTLSDEDRDQLAQYLGEAEHAAITTLARRAGGDWHDRNAGRFPALDLPRPPIAPVALFDQWAIERKPARGTVRRWRDVFVVLGERLPDGSTIDEDQARDWLRGLVNERRSAKTVRDMWRAACVAVFGWAKDQKIIAANPFSGVWIVVPRAVQTRDRAFTGEEATTILRAALASDHPAKRWVTWLQAYSGARGAEICGLRGEDVRQIEGAWCMILMPTPDRSIKTGTARTVPLHEHVIEMGFPAFAQSRGDGPLFYEPDAKQRSRTQPEMVLKMLQTWTRETLGIRGVAPTHAWRHLFRQRAVRCMPEAIVDAILGHAPASVGRGYGKPTIGDLAEALRAFPRYQV
jgi:integrase